jgi:glycerophosphoryl diester phosphodiesterase
MLQVLAHRGVWSAASQRNSLAAFADAFRHGFGVELDVRDSERRLVVCHDPADASALLFDEVLDLWAQSGGVQTIAINVKSDGLQVMLANALESRGVESYFVFDMSVPDLVGYRRTGLRYFSRQSDFEPQAFCVDRAAGIWFDGFERDWANLETVRTCVMQGLSAALVSPELHGREYRSYWATLRIALTNWPAEARNRLWLCTDHPFECRAYFNDVD